MVIGCERTVPARREVAFWEELVDQTITAAQYHPTATYMIHCAQSSGSSIHISTFFSRIVTGSKLQGIHQSLTK